MLFSRFRRRASRFKAAVAALFCALRRRCCSLKRVTFSDKVSGSAASMSGKAQESLKHCQTLPEQERTCGLSFAVDCTLPSTDVPRLVAPCALLVRTGWVTSAFYCVARLALLQPPSHSRR